MDADRFVVSTGGKGQQYGNLNLNDHFCQKVEKRSLTRHDLSVDFDGDGSLDEEDVPPGGGGLPREVGQLAGAITCSIPRGLNLDDLAAIIAAEAAISRLFEIENQNFSSVWSSNFSDSIPKSVSTFLNLVVCIAVLPFRGVTCYMKQSRQLLPSLVETCSRPLWTRQTE